MTMKKFNITSERFLNWYFEYGQDQENEELKIKLAESIIHQMYLVGFGSISVQELFDNCNQSSIRYCFIEGCDNEDNDSEIGDLFEDFEVTLIK